MDAETTELLRRAKAGDAGSLHDVLGRFRSRLLDRIRLMMGDEARLCAESGDFLQGVFVAILEDFERFEPRGDGAFLRWATQIARNRIRDQVRRRREQALSSFASETVEGGAATSGSPSGEAARHEQVERLVDAISDLPADQQRAIELRHFEGMSFADIGRRLDRNENAAQLLHARALVRLGAILRGAKNGGRSA